MTTFQAEKLDTFAIEPTEVFQDSSRIPVAGDPEMVLNGVVGLLEIPREETRNYVGAPEMGSFTQEENGDGFWETKTSEGVGTFPKFRPDHSLVVRDRFISLQKWEGFVLEVKEDSFVAQLVDLTSPGSVEEAEFPIQELSDSDKPLLSVGAVFYWNIGYLDDRHGQRHRESMIRFRRLPAWTEDEIARAREEAERIAKATGWE